jgi:hypothetical protein
MLRRLFLVAAVSAAASGCDSSSCDEIEHVVSAQTSEPGGVRSGILLGATFPAVAARPEGGVVCVACSGLARRDADLRDDGSIGSLDGPRNVALGPDGTAYTSVQLPREDLSSPVVHEVIAFEPAGGERWRVTLADFAVPLRMMADAERVYVELSGSLVALDSATGAVAWTRPDKLLGVAHEGVFTAVGTTVRHLGQDGAAIWQRPMTSLSTTFTVHDAAVTPDGGAIVVARAENTVNFGDRMLEGPPGRTLNFAVEIDPTGATRWAFKADVMLVEHVALTEGGEILLAGRLDSRRDHEDQMDAFLALANRDGIVRTHRLGGPADQLVEDLLVSTDGGALVQVSSFGGEGEPEPELRIGGHRLDEPGSYLLDIVP